MSNRKLEKAFQRLLQSGEVARENWKKHARHTFNVLSEKKYKDLKSLEIQACVHSILTELGEDVTREGLLDTPARYEKFITNWCKLQDEPDFNFTVFDSDGMDEMVIQKNIPFYSLCEHHLLPFFGTAIVAYIPSKSIVGLSKLARLVQFYASRPQNQERITKQVALYLQEQLEPLGVGVLLKARHMCMEMRGVQAYSADSTTWLSACKFGRMNHASSERMRIIKAKFNHYSINLKNEVLHRVQLEKQITELWKERGIIWE